jgi:hypothetical protein
MSSISSTVSMTGLMLEAIQRQKALLQQQRSSAPRLEQVNRSISLSLMTARIDKPRVIIGTLRVHHESSSIYVIGKKGVKKLNLLNWQQRVQALYNSGFFIMSFDMAVQLYDGTFLQETETNPLPGEQPRKLLPIPGIIGLPEDHLLRKRAVSALLASNLRHYVDRRIYANPEQRMEYIYNLVTLV